MTTTGMGWTPGSRHWLATFLVALTGAVVAAFALLKPQSPIRSPDVHIEVSAPTVNGSPNQVDPDAHSGDSPCQTGGEPKPAGWGPERPVFRTGNSPYVTLNSAAGEQGFGDERGFYDVKQSTEVGNGRTWSTKIEVERDRLYTLRVLVANHAMESPANTARQTKVMISLPTCTGTRIPTNAFVVSYDAFPSKIWGGVTLEADEVFNLAYVEGSAHLYLTGSEVSGATAEGIGLSADLLTSKGVLVGSAGADGLILPGSQHAVTVQFTVRPQFAGQ